MTLDEMIDKVEKTRPSLDIVVKRQEDYIYAADVYQTTTDDNGQQWRGLVFQATTGRELGCFCMGVLV